MDTIVALSHATRAFGDVVAVNDLTLDLRAGEILGLYGPSGSGKTTTIRLCLGVHQPTSGSATILGVPSNRLGARQRQQIGYAPQRFLYPSTLTASEAIWFAAQLYGIGWLRGRRAVRAVLEQVELWEKRGRRLADMSGGERRRVANAAALVHQPQLVFLDEPTTGLDPILRGKTWEWFRALRDEGRTLLITGHYLAEAEFCDRLALLVDGSLTALGSPVELRRDVLGGDIIEVVIAGPLAPAIDAIGKNDPVRELRVKGPNRLWIVVDKGGAGLPIIVERLNDKNVDVQSATEVRPPFDEIFEQLVERDV